ACLSKGLGAPAGSVIVGSKSFIARAKILRKTLGGGMRQIGVLCAAASVALQENLVKLEGDHRNAKILAEELNKISGLKVDIATVETNIVYCHILEGSKISRTELCKTLEQHGVLVLLEGPMRIRFVIHHQISESDVHYSVSCLQRALVGMREENGDTEHIMKRYKRDLYM
ncbi:putative low-specificity L-threonine aldolase 1, partial [Datura stramonium]|nr:putative low-specificity L-threonine aldolase 1 [Datura stramonium]